MASSIDSIQGVVDENLLRLGKALAQLRNDVCCVGQSQSRNNFRKVSATPSGSRWSAIVAGS